MSSNPDITVTIIFHNEGPYALPALDSMEDQVLLARGKGLIVEAHAVLDCANDQTRHLVRARGAWLDAIEEVPFGDLGLSRNFGVQRARGTFVAFLDGDDLWGADWLHLAHAAAKSSSTPDVIWHPEFLFYFTEGDFDRHSISRIPHSSARSYHVKHQSSMSPDLEQGALILDNIWSANAFAARVIHERYPYVAIDRTKGFGIEDWSWHLATLSAGLTHDVVPETVHIIRMKEASLNQQNTSEGLLPFLPNPTGLLDALLSRTGTGSLPSDPSSSSDAESSLRDRMAPKLLE
jgi:glycosyltransferase involved in cell wall biosynthesis